MANESPSSGWAPYFDSSSLSASCGTDLFCSKGTDGTLDRLDDFESSLIHDHAVVSSAASSSSESDCFAAPPLHQLPAWSTDSSNELSAGNVMTRNDSSTLHHQTSPGDAISPSGMLDMRRNNDGVNDDVWFIPSPETGSVPSQSLNRKKRLHFAGGNGLPSVVGFGSHDLANDIGSPGAAGNNALKAHKSVPNLNGRRISSGYTTRLEDLLAEMGWPKNEGSTDVRQSISEEEDTTVHGTHNAAEIGEVSLSSHPSAGSLASGMPQHANSSGLYQRRAESREGLMPVPAPVAVPRRSEDGEGNNTAPTTAVEHTDGGEHNPARSSNTRTRSNTVETLSDLAAVQSSMTQQRTAALAAQQQRLQQMSSSMSQNGSSHGLDGSADKEVTVLRPNAFDDSPSSATSSHHMLFASPINAGRPTTASSGSNTTELPTPITPFVGLSVGPSSDNLQWAAQNGFLFGSSMANGMSPNAGELALMQFGAGSKKEGGMTDEYLNNLNNSLGLCGVPSVAIPPSVVNPSAVMDPATFSSMFGNLPANIAAGPAPTVLQGQSVLQPGPQSQHAAALTPHQYQQRLIFPPQQQKVVPVGTSSLQTRPRAGTAMAALGSSGHHTPRHMRSTPNMHLSPSGSLDGSQYSASLTSTPVKGLRKIASNRRLNGAAGVVPESPMHRGFGEMPSSPLSPSKRRAGMLSASRSMGNLGAAAAPPMPRSSNNFEFVNYGIEDADELCSAVAPSGSYKIPLKGFGEDGDEDDEDDGLMIEVESPGMDPGTDTESVTRSPRRSSSRRPRSSTNRSGPRWEDPLAPPLPTQLPEMPTTPGGGRSIKRQKSDANMMLSGRRKSPSMTNLRRHA